MIIRTPAYTKQFRCLGGACPDTCCRNWSIVLDGPALEDYKTAPEPLRTALSDALTVDEDGDICFRLRPDGFCALLTGDGLCPIQRDWGAEHLCGHCAAYPRFTEEYGILSETVLAISCPEAARLLMDAASFALVEQNDGKPSQLLEGVDGALLTALERSRAAVLNLLSAPGQPLWSRLRRMIGYADSLQDMLDLGLFAPMAQCAPPPSDPEPGGNRQIFTARLMELCAGLEPLRPSWPTALLSGSTVLLSMKQQDYRTQCAAFEAACPAWAAHLERLACYLVFRHWHKAVNDDGLYGRAALIGAVCLLIYHLCLLEWIHAGVLTQSGEIAIWSAFSREIEHLDENLTDLIEAMFDDQSWPVLSALHQ